MPRLDVLVFKSSHRLQSCSSQLAEILASAARKAGAQVEVVDLPRLTIYPCDACKACRDDEWGECILDDDMRLVYPKLKAARAIVIASPIYWATFSAQAKLLIDRWYALETPHGSRLAGKKMALLLTYGDEDAYISGAVNAMHTFEAICRYLKVENAGMVYGTGWEHPDAPHAAGLCDKARRLGERLALP